MIRVGKYGYKDTIPTFQDFTPIMVRLKSDGGVWQLSSYYLKCQIPDEPGKIGVFENIWQASKLYKDVTSQDQQAKWNKSLIIWKHPAERHVDNENRVLPAYLAWRNKLMNAPLAVRYPIGYNERHSVLCSLMPDKFNNNNIPISYRIVGGADSNKKERYIAARKEIYCQLYINSIHNLPEFKKLQERYQKGEKLLLIDVDGPRYTKDFPFNQVINKSIEINELNILNLLNDSSQPFGHCYVLAVCLMGQESWLSSEKHFCDNCLLNRELCDQKDSQLIYILGSYLSLEFFKIILSYC